MRINFAIQESKNIETVTIELRKFKTPKGKFERNHNLIKIFKFKRTIINL